MTGIEHIHPAEWATREFGRADLGDRRLTTRLVTIAAQILLDARSSIPKAAGPWSQAKALYRFMSNERVTHAGVLASHAAATAERCRGLSRILVIGDTTHCSFGGREQERSLGPVDTGGHSVGFLCHSALAVDPETGSPLGCLAQKVWARSRTKHPKKESTAARRKRRRESSKWAEVATAADEALAALGPEKPLVIEVFDREGDHFDTIEVLDQLGHDFVIRAARDRALDVDEADEDDTPEAAYLAEAAATAPVLGTRAVTVPARPGQPERQAVLTIRAAEAVLLPPKSRYRQGISQGVNLVYASEEHPPSGAERISWLLLTRQPAQTLAEAAAVIEIYRLRWLIEEFHMGLKTGCSLEKRELRTFARLTNLLAVCTPIAIEMLILRDLTHSAPDTPAADVLPPTRLIALKILRPELRADATIYQALRAIAGLGGFLGRKSDREPGWRRLWLGFHELLAAESAIGLYIHQKNHR